METDPQFQEDEDDAEDRQEPDSISESGGEGEFYWQQARENLLSPSGVRMFQLAYRHKDKPFEDARLAIDAEYENLSPRLQRKGRAARRHGGIFINNFNLFQQLGLMHTEEDHGTKYLRTTPAGEQAAILLEKMPDPLRIIPYFLLELLSRYRFNNPFIKSPKNAALGAEIAQSNLFPYWTLYKIMRSLGDTITKDELARFVFKLKRMEDIPKTISQIAAYRQDRQMGMPQDQLTEKYGPPLAGAIGQPKYIMGRAGFQTGVLTLHEDEYKIRPEYLDFIDEMLKREPEFEELSEESWIREYGDPVESTTEEYVPFQSDEALEPLVSELPDGDPILTEVRTLLENDSFAGVILIGPPGTGKTWYARQIAIKLTAGKRARIREVQFHPSYQYEDFVEGYVPDGKGGFELVNRHLLKICFAASVSGATHVLVIDELSRTDPSRVMGEALTYMEFSLRDQNFYLPSGRQAVIPKNLYFLATMNPEDRSVDEIDAAMDRRWGKIYLAPDPAVLTSFLARNQMSPPLRGRVITFFQWIQKHYPLGHAFFRTIRDAGGLKRLWANQLQFLFEKAFRYDPDTLHAIKGAWAQMMTAVEAPPPVEAPALQEPPAGE